MHRRWPRILLPVLFSSALCAQDFAVGADLSFLRDVEAKGIVFKDAGAAKPGLQIFRDHGYNWIRLRLFHTPTSLPNNLEYTIALAKDARKLGYKFLLDYHYSDTWADPGKQGIPKAWTGFTHEQLVEAVFEYTRDSMLAFRAAGAFPDMVQIGNEVSGGMLWPDGKASNWNNFTDLVKAGIRGVQAATGDSVRPRIMMHTDKGGDAGRTRQYFDRLRENEVEFDVVGLSYYPWWHGSLDGLTKNLASLATTFSKDIIVVEAAYHWRPVKERTGNFENLPFPQTPEGQKAFLETVARIVRDIPNGRGKGVFWWEPAVSSDHLRNRGFFDNDNNALPVIHAFDSKSK